MNHNGAEMKIAARHVLAMLAATMLLSSTAYAIINPLDKARYEKKSKVAYTIQTPQKTLSNGTIIPARKQQVEWLSEDQYFPHVVLVKTKQLYKFGRTTKQFPSDKFHKSINSTNITSINAPFANLLDKENSSLDEEELGKIYEIHYSSDVDPYEYCMELMSNPDIEYAVPVFKRKMFYTPNDPSYSSQWGLAKINMPEAWNITKGSSSVVIGIIDTGVDWTHEDLKANIWSNSDEIAGNNKDDDNNGYIDDIRGWDFVGNITTADYYNGEYTPDNNPTNLVHDHGTHVAGCAAAVTNNSKGVAGPAMNCKIMPVKVSSEDQSLTGILKGYEGITYAASNGAKIINCSWGGAGGSAAEQDVIDYAFGKGSVVVVAAGNDYQLNVDNGGSYPAGYDNVLCVGATTSSDAVANFSNIGTKVTVYSPGSGIYSTLPNNTYGNNDGTSMASPITAGVAALVLSLHPDWTPKQIIHQIRSTSDNVLTTNASKRRLYYGRLNAKNALSYNNGNTEFQVPGVEVSSMKLSSGTNINTFNPITANLTITNYLAEAKNLKVTVTSLNSFLTVNNNTSTFPTIATGISNTQGTNSANMSIGLQLASTNPWYSGTAELLVTFEGTNYTDYQLINVEISLSSNNSYYRMNTFPDDYTPTWHNSSSPSTGVYFAVGTGGLFGTYGGYYKYANNQAAVNMIATSPATAIYAVDAQKAYIGISPGTGSDPAAVYKTTNGGTNWTTLSVQGITSFINDIHFFDSNNGVLIGDPKNNKWGIGLTTNGGTSWLADASIPAPSTNEKGTTRCCSWYGKKYGWFGTTAGRVFKTTDLGETWTASTITGAATIHLVAFRDSVNGIAIYSASTASDASKLVASTTNNGQTWNTNKSNLTDLTFEPVSLFTISDAQQIFALCENGEIIGTPDLGATWSAILSEEDAIRHCGSLIAYSGQTKARIWEAGKTVGYLDFSYMPYNASKILEAPDGTECYCDSILVNNSVMKLFNIKNTGNVDLGIYSCYFSFSTGTDSTEFELVGSAPTSITTGETKKLRFRFTPADTGTRSSYYNITSDATPNVLTLHLYGVGYKKPDDTTSVDDTNAESLITVSNSPNPCSDMTYLNIYFGVERNVQIFISNLLGEKVSEVYSGVLSEGENKLPVNTSQLPNGVYNFIIKYGTKAINQKFVINR